MPRRVPRQPATAGRPPNHRPWPQLDRRLAQPFEAAFDRVARAAVSLKRHTLDPLEMALDSRISSRMPRKRVNGRLEAAHAFPFKEVPRTQSRSRLFNEVDMTTQESGQVAAQVVRSAEMIEPAGGPPHARPHPPPRHYWRRPAPRIRTVRARRRRARKSALCARSAASVSERVRAGSVIASFPAIALVNAGTAPLNHQVWSRPSPSGRGRRRVRSSGVGRHARGTAATSLRRGLRPTRARAGRPSHRSRRRHSPARPWGQRGIRTTAAASQRDRNAASNSLTRPACSCCTQCPAPSIRWQPTMFVHACSCIVSNAPGR